MKRTDTVIVGAGPYGLSIAAHLKAAKLPYLILGSPLESWRSFMPDGMFLKSEPFASSLWDPKRRFTYEKFCLEKGLPYQKFGKPVSLENFVAYGDWFREKAVGEVTNLRVTSIDRTSHASKFRFTVELSNGSSVECRHVILATGYMAFRHVPTHLSHLSPKVCTHSGLVKDVRKYSGKDVTVLGAGQSALETAALVREAGAKVRLIVRKSAIQWNGPSTPVNRPLLERIRVPEAGLGNGWKILGISELPRIYRGFFPKERRHRFFETSWGPAGSLWLKKRIEGAVETHLSHEVVSATEENGKVRLTVKGPEGTSEILTDHVIPATGYKLDLNRIDYLAPGLKHAIACEGYAPKLDSRFETSVRGLYIVGITTAPTFGPVMRFMFGAKHAAPIVTRHLKAKRRLQSLGLN